MALAVVFPGQGSHSTGMLAALAAAEPRVRATFAEASERLGYDLWALVQNGPAEDLNQTQRTQPAMLSAGVAVYRVWEAQGGPRPALMAGHSLGEWTALVCSGALGFADAVALVAERGRLMQEAVPEGVGAMAAILGLEDEAVGEVCTEVAAGEVVTPVNFNSPGQVVVAGHRAAVERAVARAKQAGAKRAVILPVSVPSHCELMQPAAARLAPRLEATTIRPPQVPVINNVDVARCEEPAAIRDALLRQLYRPVRWVDSVRQMVAAGASTVLEFGPGGVLTALNKRIDRGARCAAVYDPATLQQALSDCARGTQPE